MGYARLSISPALLLHLLHLPANTRILHANVTQGDGEILLTIAHPEIRDEPVEPPPIVAPVFKRQEPVVFLDWGQSSRGSA